MINNYHYSYLYILVKQRAAGINEKVKSTSYEVAAQSGNAETEMFNTDQFPIQN